MQKSQFDHDAYENGDLGDFNHQMWLDEVMPTRRALVGKFQIPRGSQTPQYFCESEKKALHWVNLGENVGIEVEYGKSGEGYLLWLPVQRADIDHYFHLSAA